MPSWRPVLHAPRRPRARPVPIVVHPLSQLFSGDGLLMAPVAEEVGRALNLQPGPPPLSVLLTLRTAHDRRSGVPARQGRYIWRARQRPQEPGGCRPSMPISRTTSRHAERAAEFIRLSRTRRPSACSSQCHLKFSGRQLVHAEHALGQPSRRRGRAADETVLEDLRSTTRQ